MPHYGELTDQALQALGYRTIAQLIALGYRTEAELIAAGFCRIATGQYTGDGTLANAITGVGFTPKFVMIVEHGVAEGAAAEYFWASDAMAANTCVHVTAAGAPLSRVNTRIISLDVDGFTVSDAGGNFNPNTLDFVYDYICFG